MSPPLADIESLWLVGCGNMGGALLSRWLGRGLRVDRVTVIDPAGVAPEGVMAVAAPEGAPPRVLVLAVKPQMFDTAAETLSPYLAPDTLIISILAGTRLAALRSRFGDRVIRAMPNTPARVGKGVTALFGPSSDEDRTLADRLMAAAGRTVWLDEEDQFDAVTGLSGSGPAYLFAFIEAMTAAGEAAGFPAETAAALAKDTVIGAAALADESDETPAQLRVRVTSPKGTTQAGLDVLREPLDDLLKRTVEAAANRSRELGG